MICLDQIHDHIFFPSSSSHHSFLVSRVTLTLSLSPLSLALCLSFNAHWVNLGLSVCAWV